MSTLLKKSAENSLGKKVAYSKRYDPSVLYRIKRATKSERYSKLGLDRWLSYEFTYLSKEGSPISCALEITVPANTKYIVESKSLKLYLGSFSLEKFSRTDETLSIIKKDLESLLESSEIGLIAIDLSDVAKLQVQLPPGTSIDCASISCPEYDNPSSLTLSVSNEPADEILNTNLFRSLCPVTEQPDYATILIEYKGNKIDPASLLRYLTAYRNHAGFHETCCEKIFEDILESCKPEELTIACFFNRRGGIEINPIRSTVAFDKSKYYCRFSRQ